MKRPILKRGDQRPEVRELKTILRRHGCWSGNDSVIFGLDLETAVKYFQGTRLGQDGKFLVADGIVGPKTWWALDNASGPAQKSSIKPAAKDDFSRRYGMFSKDRREFIRRAFAEHAKGVREIPDGSNAGPRIDLYTQGFGPVPWCALFVSWLFREVTGRWPGNRQHAHVQTSWRAAGERKRTYLKGSKVPVPGDLAVWHYAKGAGHVSVVVAVSPDGRQINTIGGNEGNRVKLGLRTLAREAQMVGFIDLFDDSPPSDFPRELLSGADATGLSLENSR
jgi:uncharacterized protein (TIGR02594 family)